MLAKRGNFRKYTDIQISVKYQLLYPMVKFFLEIDITETRNV